MLKSYSKRGDTAESFSKYVSQQDKYDLPAEQSYFANQTLLIESTPVVQKASFCLNSAQSSRHSFILKKEEGNHHYCDINEEFQITISDHQNDRKRRKKLSTKIPLEDLCTHLIKTIQNLQIKIQKLQANQKFDKKGSFSKDQSSVQKEKIKSSHLNCTKDTENNKYRNQRCQNCLVYSNIMQSALESIQSKVKANIYQFQMQKARKQLGTLLMTNEQYKREIKKLKGENRKFKELIKQYQSYNKRNHQMIQNNNNAFEQRETQYESNQQKSSQIFRQYSQRDNSLEQRLHNNQSNQFLLENKKQNKYYSHFNSQKTKNNSIFQKQTPKTPQHFILRNFAKQENQKTELKNKHRSCNGLLKQIIEFQQRNQCILDILNQKNFIPQVKRGTKATNNESKYPYNFLLQSQFENSNKYAKKFIDLPDLQTMQSLKQIQDEHQSVITKQYLSKNRFKQTKFQRGQSENQAD